MTLSTASPATTRYSFLYLPFSRPPDTAYNRQFTMLWATFFSLIALTQAAPSLDAPPWLTSKLSKRQGGTTMLRFGCAQVVIDRLDPLVNPGQAPSPHQHQIVGGNGFNMTMTTGDVSKTASCTTCAFSKDLSNYWTANMYFKSPKNGTYKRVRQLGAAYVSLIMLRSRIS
jgi:hypothetical protein